MSQDVMTSVTHSLSVVWMFIALETWMLEVRRSCVTTVLLPGNTSLSTLNTWSNTLFILSGYLLQYNHLYLFIYLFIFRMTTTKHRVQGVTDAV